MIMGLSFDCSSSAHLHNGDLETELYSLILNVKVQGPV